MDAGKVRRENFKNLHNIGSNKHIIIIIITSEMTSNKEEWNSMKLEVSQQSVDGGLLYEI